VERKKDELARYQKRFLENVGTWKSKTVVFSLRSPCAKIHKWLHSCFLPLTNDQKQLKWITHTSSQIGVKKFDLSDYSTGFNCSEWTSEWLRVVCPSSVDFFNNDNDPQRKSCNPGVLPAMLRAILCCVQSCKLQCFSKLYGSRFAEDRSVITEA